MVTARNGRLLVDARDVASIVIADTYLQRLRGLLGTRGTPGALLLTPCNGVHGVGMVYSLDVALLTGDLGPDLDGDLSVARTATLPPFGLVPPRRGVRHVLEAERGAFARWGLEEGSRLTIQPGRNT